MVNKYVLVPWEVFKITPTCTCSCLTPPKAHWTPPVNGDQFTTQGQFDQESQKVDAYWKAHLSNKGNN